MSTELTEIESSRLKECELIIATGLHTFIVVANALNEIRESELFKNEFNSFDEYCQAKWDIKGNYANRLIRASSVINNIVPIGTFAEELINSENKARILSKFESEIQKLIVQDLHDNNITEITASFLEGFAKAYLVINSKVKEIKATPLFSFNSESEMIEKAKSLITMPEPQIIEVEVIKQDESLIKSLADKDTKIADLQKRIVQQSDSNLELQSKLQDHDNKIADFNKTIKELEQAKLKLTEYEDLREATDTLNDLKAKKETLFSESYKIRQILDALDQGRKFFNNHIFAIGAIKLEDRIKKQMQKEIHELIELVDSWKFGITQNLVLENNLLTV